MSLFKSHRPWPCAWTENDLPEITVPISGVHNNLNLERGERANEYRGSMLYDACSFCPIPLQGFNDDGQQTGRLLENIA